MDGGGDRREYELRNCQRRWCFKHFGTDVEVGDVDNRVNMKETKVRHRKKTPMTRRRVGVTGCGRTKKVALSDSQVGAGRHHRCEK